MEFPDLGQHCSLSDCQRLDFLPIKCSCCKKPFCGVHFQFDAHHCDGSPTERDNQVPVCPLCEKPVALKFGESPDVVVSRHIDQNCDQRREKIFKNRCSVPGCRQKEVMPLKCQNCHRNHCIRHRHPADHECNERKSNNPHQQNNFDSSKKRPMITTGPPPKSQTIPSSLNSFTQRGMETWENLRSNVVRSLSKGINNTDQSPVTNLQGDLTEEEALRIAIQESLDQTSPSTSSNRNTSTGNNEKCFIS